MDEALKLTEENLSGSQIEGIDIEELKEMNARIIAKINTLSENVKIFTKRKEKEDIPTKEIKKFDETQKQGWKELRELEKIYSFMLKKAKQKGIKQKDIESETFGASPNIEMIKKQKSSMGAIVRKMGNNNAV